HGVSHRGPSHRVTVKQLDPPGRELRRDLISAEPAELTRRYEDGIIGRATLRQLRRQLDLEEASLDDRTSAGPPHRTRKAGVACGCPPRVEGCDADADADADADDRCVQAARTREYRLLSTA